MKLFTHHVRFLLIAFKIGGIVSFNALFKVPMDGCGNFICASDAPGLSGTVTSVGLCALWCQRQTGCQRFNWRRANQSCELYLFEPREYIAADTCAQYMVNTALESYIFIAEFIYKFLWIHKIPDIQSCLYEKPHGACRTCLALADHMKEQSF